MAYGIIFVTLLLSTLTVSLQENVTQTSDYEYDYEDDYYDDREPINVPAETQETKDLIPVSENNSKEAPTKGPNILKVKRDREELTTEKQVAQYEVTEFVIDVPDVNTRRVPVVTNFTLTKPLNFAGVPNNRTDNAGANVKDEGDEIINSILIPNNRKISNNNQDKNMEGSKFNFDASEEEYDYFSNSNPKESFEEEFNKHFGSDEDEFEDFEVKEEPKSSKGFKDHFHNFKKSIVNEFNSVVDKHKDGIHDSLHKIVHGPISFFSKLQRKSSDLVKKLHDAVSRHKYHDNDDDIGYHDEDHSDEDY